MSIKFFKLFISLLLVVLIGMLVLHREGDTSSEEPDDFEVSDKYIYAPISLFHYDNEVLAVNKEKSPENGNSEGLRADENPYYNLIKQYDWNHKVADAVMREESHFIPDAYNLEGHNGCTGSFGLFQIACVNMEKYGIEHYRELYNPETNVEIAYKIWKENQWKPWGVCQSPNQKVQCW